jgi:hypothetical protein
MINGENFSPFSSQSTAENPVAAQSSEKREDLGYTKATLILECVKTLLKVDHPELRAAATKLIKDNMEKPTYNKGDEIKYITLSDGSILTLDIDNGDFFDDSDSEETCGITFLFDVWRE